MGNALVVGVVARIAKILEAEFYRENALGATITTADKPSPSKSISLLSRYD